MKRQQTPLWLLLTVGVVVSVTLGSALLCVFARLAEGRGWWITNHHLTSAQWYDVVRSTIASMGVVGIGAAGLLAYRRQHTSEATHQLSVQLREDSSTVDLRARFATAAGQLGHASAAVRLAGVYAMAALADDWHTANDDDVQMQVCIDVLCAYLRIPYDPDSTKAGDGEREVRLTVISVIRDHLQDPNAPTTWCARNLDFTGATFDGGNFARAQFSGGIVTFSGATFAGGTVNFFGATFADGLVTFSKATFSRGTVDFSRATFDGGTVNFSRATFDGGTVNFFSATFSRGIVTFHDATFSRGIVDFLLATFSGGTVTFHDATFSGGIVNFSLPLDWNPGPTVDWTDTAPKGVRPTEWPPTPYSPGYPAPPPSSDSHCPG